MSINLFPRQPRCVLQQQLESKLTILNRLLQKNSIYDANYDSDYDDYDDNCVTTISINNDNRELEPMNLDICIGSTKTKVLVISNQNNLSDQNINQL